MQVQTNLIQRSLICDRRSPLLGKNIFIAGLISREPDSPQYNSTVPDYSPLIAALNNGDLSRNPGVERCICLGSVRSLKTFFDNGGEFVEVVNSSTPDPTEFDKGEVVLLEDRLPLIRDEDSKGNSIWRVIPINGNELTAEELKILKAAYGLRKKAIKLEPHAYPLTTNTIKGDGKDRARTLRENLPDPETSEVDTYQIPNSEMILYLRSKSGNRVWAALPVNGVSLSDSERATLEGYLKTTLNDLPKVTNNDVICSGFYVENFFSGNYDSTNAKIKAKGVPEPSEHAGKTFTPPGADFTMEKKCTKCGTHWTVPRSKHKEAAIYFGLELRNSTLTIPKDAIYLWGEKAQEFWKEAGETEAGYKNFNAEIKERFGSPYESKEFFIPLNGDKGKVHYIFRGEDGAKRYWWIQSIDYKPVANILGYQCKKEIALNPNLTEQSGVGEQDLDDLLLMIRETNRELSGLTSEPSFDHRDDGTDDNGLKLIPPRQFSKRSTASIRVGLEGEKRRKS